VCAGKATSGRQYRRISGFVSERSLMNVRRVKSLVPLVLLSAGFVLSACAFERAPEVLQNPIYKTGFSEGCETAHTRVSGFNDTIHRNEALYKTQEVYRAGWGDGYASCGGQRQFDDNSVFNERRDNTVIRY